MKVKIIEANSNRAKNRVSEHGEIFTFLDFGRPQCYSGEEAILIESLDKTWLGWFTLKELEIDMLRDDHDDKYNFE